MIDSFKRLTYLAAQRLIGSRVWQYYNEFFTFAGTDYSTLKRHQTERLSNILKHASTEIPYYRKHISYRNKLCLKDYPVLTKADIRTHFQELMTEGLRKKYSKGSDHGHGYSWMLVKTGGTTGIPTTVIHDREFRDRGRAARLYSQYLCDFPFGVSYFWLWGSMRDINESKDDLAHSIQSFLSNQTILNAFRMSENKIEQYIETINSSSRNYMMAYVDAAYQLGNYAIKKGKKIRPLKAIMACAGTLTDEVRNTLIQAFSARVHNKYGSRECADMACECKLGGFHIYSNNIYIEVVGEDGKHCPPGKLGKILITLLFNYSFPIIRYEIGDWGALSEKSCECGLPFPLLDRVEGRKVEFLSSCDGGYVSPVYIRHLIGVIHNPGHIRRFQLIQNSTTGFKLILEIEKNIQEDSFNKNVANILKDLRTVLGDQSHINVRRVLQIPTSKSGKFLYTINKVKSC